MIHWMLTRIARQPTYGFEILKEIESKTDGAWRPGPGSVYPILKRMLDAGYVRAETAGKGRPDQRLFQITPKGVEHIAEAREVFRKITKNWGAMRGIFVDLIGPASVPEFILAGTTKQFDVAKEIINRNRSEIGGDDLRSMLVEYSLILDSQRRWVEGQSAMLGAPKSQSRMLRHEVGRHPRRFT